MCALTARVRPPDSIRNDRRLLCQPVCQHRTPGRQLSEHPTAVSVLVPLIKINKETTKIFKKRFLKRGEEEILRHGNIPQPSPTEKQNLDVVSHSARPSSSPGSPAVQSSQPSPGSPRKGSQPSCTPAAKQKEACLADSAKQRTNRKKRCNQPGLSGKEQPAHWSATPAVPGDPHPPLDLSFPRSPEEQLIKMMEVDIRAHLRTSPPPPPSRPSWEPLLRLLSPAALD